MGKKRKSRAPRNISPAQASRIFARQAEQRKLDAARERVRKALAGFRPRKADAGKIVFIGTQGGRDASGKGRRGFAVYVRRSRKTGKLEKIPVRQRVGGKVEKVARARTVSSVDPSRVRSKAAKREFLQSFVDKKVGSISRVSKVKKGERGIAWGGKNPRVILDISKALVREAKNTTRKQFLVSINFLIVPKGGGKPFVETVAREFQRMPGQKLVAGHVENFLRRECYADLAQRLAARGLVSEGSARHVQKLRFNRGMPRDQWVKEMDTKTGKRAERWEAWDYDEVRIERVEWQIERMAFKRGE